jgi:hypothetical protein
MEPAPATKVRIKTFVALGLIASFAMGFSLGRLSPRDAAPARSDAMVGGRATGTLIVDPPPTCHESRVPVTISQNRADGPVGMVAAWFEHEQAVAQTFTSPAAGLRLVEFAPTFDSAIGPGATLSIHAVTDLGDPMSGRELARFELDSLAVIRGEPARIELDPAVPLDCGAVYSIVIRPRPGSELAIQATAFARTGKVYREGAMFMGRPGRWLATGGDMRFEVLLAPATPH